MIKTSSSESPNSVGQIESWLECVFECRQLVQSGQLEAAEGKFLDLNQDIESYLTSGGEVDSELESLLALVAGWNRGSSFGWHWRLHHGLLK